MSQLLGGVDVQATAAAIASIGAIVGLAIAGLRQGLKTVREERQDAGARLTGGVIMDNLSMTMLTERLREHSEVTRESIAATRENTAAQHETAHQVERLRDRMA